MGKMVTPLDHGEDGDPALSGALIEKRERHRELIVRGITRRSRFRWVPRALINAGRNSPVRASLRNNNTTGLCKYAEISAGSGSMNISKTASDKVTTGALSG